MRKLSAWLWVAAALLGGIAFATGRWDGAFVKVGTIVTDGGMSPLAVPSASYIKVVCPYGANVTALEKDAGSACSTNNCELVQFALGEKWYSQLTNNQDKVAVYSADAGAISCHVYRSSN